jgi:predicted component of type VI protein secretion system
LILGTGSVLDPRTPINNGGEKAMNPVLALQVVQEGRVVRRAYMEQKEGFASIGRDERSSLRLDDSLVSRIHCCIAADEDGFVVEDLCSKNGTLLNGHAVHWALLRHRDALTVGDCEIRVSIGDASKAALERFEYEPLDAEGLPASYRFAGPSGEPTLDRGTGAGRSESMLRHAR